MNRKRNRRSNRKETQPKPKTRNPKPLPGPTSGSPARSLSPRPTHSLPRSAQANPVPAQSVSAGPARPLARHRSLQRSPRAPADQPGPPVSASSLLFLPPCAQPPLLAGPAAFLAASALWATLAMTAAPQSPLPAPPAACAF